MKLIIKNSFIAGILIGIGCIINLCSGNSVLGSFLFSLGLITVIVQERALFTGKIGYWDFSIKESLRYLIIILFFNLIGISFICYFFKEFSGIVLNTATLISVKLSETWYNALLRSIGCGMLMYIAVEGYKRTKNLLSVIMPVMVFILCGFDHCIANYGYMVINNTFWCNQLPIWILGNSIGSLIISKI